MKPAASKHLFVGVHKSGPFNSTDFTDCCGLAVLHGDKHCPGCGGTVLRIGRPSSDGKCRMCGVRRDKCNC